MLLRRFTKLNLINYRNVSALYITGDKAMENYSVLTPYLEIDERVKNFKEIQENISRRKLSINLHDLKSEYELFSTIERRKNELENRRNEIAALMKKDATEGLRLEGKNVREDLKKLKENSYFLEDKFIHNFLKIPNFLHTKTPKELEIIYSYLERPQEKSSNESQQISNDLIEFYDPTCYYMKGDAAKFDFKIPLDVTGYYQKAGFIKFSNPDFVRSIIPEAAAIDIQKTFLLKEEHNENKLNLLHLVGNGSMLSYLPFISKLVAYKTQLPIKLISTGKVYNNHRNIFDLQNLYEVAQSTCCQVFIATSDSSSFDNVINEQIEHWRKIFEAFDQHFRIVIYPADALKSSESYKMGVEVYSVCHNNYVQVGSFSYHSDFISKRLLFNYKHDKILQFPHIFSGTVVNVMKLLVNMIEIKRDLRNFV